MTPGHRQRQRDVEERGAAARVQVAGRLDEVLVEPVDRHEQRQDRERQESVRHPEDHARVGVQQDRAARRSARSTGGSPLRTPLSRRMIIQA